MKKLLLPIAALAFTASLSSGCSVIMAASGSDTPQYERIEVGQSRDSVLLIMGQPTKSISDDGKRADYFTFEKGNEASVGRAALHAFADVMTLGAWEVIGTPLEAIQGDDVTVWVAYDAEGKVERFGAREGKSDLDLGL